MKSFYNTINESGQLLIDLEERAETCEGRVLTFFKENYLSDFTPYEVSNFLYGYGYPLTSIRRAITNLTSSGRLEKLPHKRPGAYKTNNYAWRFKC